MKIVLCGGRVIDPQNAVDSIQNVYIADGAVSMPFPLSEADRIINAEGKIVCPGFVDIHMHEDHILPDGSIYADPEKAIFNCMLRMGVTTAVGGNCGECVANPADYLDKVDAQGVAVNVAMLAGHEYFRNQAGGTDKYAPVSEEQKLMMQREIEESLRRGCLGVSYGIRYVPGLDMDELKKTAAGCKKYGRLMAAHIRSDAEEVFDATVEFLDAGLELGVPVEISHIGSMAGFGQMERFLQLVDSYKFAKPDIGCDCYPYDAFSTSLGSTTYDEGWLERYGCDYSVVELAEGKYKGQRCTKEIFDEVRREHPDCTTICYVMQQNEVDMAYRHPGVCLGSDGTLSEGQGHPRASGTFPRLIARYVRGGVITMYDAISMMTNKPANRLGLENKGRLNVGADADVVIFDPEKIEDRATFAQPLLPPVGIDYVIVNGEIAAENSVILNSRLGKSVRL